MQKWAKIDEIIKLLKEHSMEGRADSEKIKTPIAIMINGEWGTGKSHMYREYLAPEITNRLSKSPIYTSVFGKKDENEIIQDLVAQFLRKENESLNKCKEVLSGISSLMSINADVSFIFKAFEKEDLKDSIVCIDDFERLSEKIPIEDVLGLISELKENKGCHIILLCNKDKINEENKPKFETYIEKIIDATLAYDPEPWQQFLIAKNWIKNYKVESEAFQMDVMEDILSKYNVKDAITKLNINNLREIKKVIHCFNQYCGGLNNPLLNNNEEIQVLFTNTILCFLFYCTKIKELKKELSKAEKQHWKYTYAKYEQDEIKEHRQEIIILNQRIETLKKQIKEYEKHVIWNQDFFFPISCTLYDLFEEYYDNNIFTFRNDQKKTPQDHLNNEETFISILQEFARQYDFQKKYNDFLANKQNNALEASKEFFDKYKGDSSSVWFMLGIVPNGWYPPFFKKEVNTSFNSLFFDNNPQYKKKLQELTQKAFNKVKDQNNHWLNQDMETKDWLKQNEYICYD